MKKVSLAVVTLIFLATSVFATESVPTTCPYPIMKAKELAAKSDDFLDHFDQSIPLYRDQVKIKFGLESRYRLELKNNFNFNDRTNEDDAVNLLRNRLNANLTLGSYLRVFAEGQDSESFASSGLNNSFCEIRGEYDTRSGT